MKIRRRTAELRRNQGEWGDCYLSGGKEVAMRIMGLSTDRLRGNPGDVMMYKYIRCSL